MKPRLKKREKVITIAHTAYNSEITDNKIVSN